MGKFQCNLEGNALSEAEKINKDALSLASLFWEGEQN